MHMDWDKLRVFHAVAEAGSFTHAGEKLRLSQSAISRQISALEKSLDSPLFHRHARGLVLTEQGEALYRTVRDIFAKLAETQALIAESKDRPEGPLRVTATVGLGSIWLTPRIRDFIEAYPDISVTLIVTDQELDLSKREADVAIRVVPPRQPDLIQRHLMTVNFHIYGSADYLKRFGIPKALEELDRHRLVSNLENPPAYFRNSNWLLEAGAPAGKPRQPIFRVNSIYGILQAVTSGLGLGSLPDYMIPKDSNLVRVLPDLGGPGLDTFFVYPEAHRNSARVVAFRDFLIRQIAETEF
jgi:DNA-binding transcriptional LysR family regulator